MLPPLGKALDFLCSAPPVPFPLPFWQPHSCTGPFPDAEQSQRSEAFFPAGCGLLGMPRGLSFLLTLPGTTKAFVPLGQPSASHHPHCGCPAAHTTDVAAEQCVHALETCFLLSPQSPPTNRAEHLKQQKLYCIYTSKPQNTLQSNRE